MVGVDDPGERRLVGLRPDVGIGGPDQLVPGDALAGFRHPCQAQIGAIGQDDGEQRVLVVAHLAGAQVGERRRKAGRAVDLVQQFGDAHARQQGVEPVGERVGLRRGDRLQRRDVQPVGAQLDPVELAAQQPLRKAFQPFIKVMPPCGEPVLGRGGQLQLRRDRGHRRRGQEVRVEAAVAGRPLHPHVPRAQPVAQGGEHRRLVQPPVRLAVLGDEPPPLLAERHRRIRREVTLAGLVELLEQLDRGQDRVLAPGRLERERFEGRRGEFPDGDVPVGGADERILLREIGEAGHLAAHAQQLRPAHRFVDEGEGVAVAFLGQLERLDGPVEQAHQPADVLRFRDAGLLLAVLGAREGAADQLVGHVERGVGEPALQVDQQRHQRRAPAVRRTALDQVGGRGHAFAGELAETGLMNTPLRLVYCPQ